MFKSVFWQRHLTTIGALVATLGLGFAVFLGHLQASRAVGVVVFAWMLALHALGNRFNAEQHERAILMGLVGLQKAGYAVRAGRPGEAVQDLTEALGEIEQEVRSSLPAAPQEGGA